MNSRQIFVGAALLVGLSGCATADKELLGFQDPTWGDANRATMAAQVINPNPEYDTRIPETTATNAVRAIDRYRDGQVEQPDRVSTTAATTDDGPR
ncbi:hypothetical protein [Erythrobacter sp. JK5]|uniref:hypothetical protein n=1 Tax=Erythrobacter sp. JK5 TaxID=2829500 RepID=UPI001BAD7D6A|nr:hypothetical protein [Erythrobacter sp. JK5]QUL38122.1 hypothetical protein KDC96_01475 [Erythrobacter sp. JK5]